MCPVSFEIRLSPGERNRLIFWQEPTFTDNVGVEHVYKTRVCTFARRIRPRSPYQYSYVGYSVTCAIFRYT